MYTVLLPALGLAWAPAAAVTCGNGPSPRSRALVSSLTRLMNSRLWSVPLCLCLCVSDGVSVSVSQLDDRAEAKEKQHSSKVRIFHSSF